MNHSLTTPSAPASSARANGAPDPRPLLWRAVDQAERQVVGVGRTDLDRATPCAGWSVRTLLGHLVAVERRITHIAGGGQPFEVPSLVTDVPDEGWTRAWAEARTELESALADDAVLDRIFAHPAGDFPARQAIVAYVNELTVHGWDLARALGSHGVLGSADALDDDLAEASLGPIRQFLPAEPRGGPVPFGPVVEVPADAPAYDRLLGWMGRDPHWTA